VAPDPFTSEVLDMPPTERRVTPGADRGELERRAGILAERQAVLDRPVGTKPNAGLADEMLADPEFEAAVRGDTRSNRVVLNPEEAQPRVVNQEEVARLRHQERALERMSPDDPMYAQQVRIVDETRRQVGDTGAVREGELIRAGSGLARAIDDDFAAGRNGTPDLADDLIDVQPARSLPPAAAGDASIQRTIERLREFGFTPEEIAEILASGG
jgi:hypothetical protein